MFTPTSGPVGSGLVASIARPGGNVTGLSNLFGDLSGKQLQLLKEAVPQASRFAVLYNPVNSATAPMLNGAQAAARALEAHLQLLPVWGANELASAFSAVAGRRVGTLLTLADGVVAAQQVRPVDLATKNRLPVLFFVREFVDAGRGNPAMLLRVGPLALRRSARTIQKFGDIRITTLRGRGKCDPSFS